MGRKIISMILTIGVIVCPLRCASGEICHQLAGNSCCQDQNFNCVGSDTSNCCASAIACDSECDQDSKINHDSCCSEDGCDRPPVNGIEHSRLFKLRPSSEDTPRRGDCCGGQCLCSGAVVPATATHSKMDRRSLVGHAICPALMKSVMLVSCGFEFGWMSGESGNSGWAKCILFSLFRL